MGVPAAGERSWKDFKESGNQHFFSQEFLKAAASYTSAIKAFQGSDEDLAVLHSNRCAALLKLMKVSKALQDAEKCVELRPDWEKGYFRKGSVLEAAQEFEKALQAYRDGAQRAPDSKEMVQKREAVEKLLKRKAHDERKMKGKAS